MNPRNRIVLKLVVKTGLSLALIAALLILALDCADQAAPPKMATPKSADDSPPATPTTSPYAGDGLVYSPEFQQWNAPACSPAPVGGFRCYARVITDETGMPVAAAGPGGFGPAQILGAYGLSGTATGVPIIAIVDAYDDPTAADDLKTFSDAFGIPELAACPASPWPPTAPCFRKADQTGGTNYPSFDPGWLTEITLDVQTAHSICQNCVILLVEANSESTSDMFAAIDEARTLGAKVISNSWGGGEFSGEQILDTYFNHAGIAITFSTGDNGYGTQYPAASPYVTAVGGTTLAVDGANRWSSETAWSGAGSGCSQYELQPSFQSALGLTGCSNRMVADVSADADPNTGMSVYYSTADSNGQTGWFVYGGTSLACPIIAAAYALGQIGSGVMANTLPYSLGVYGTTLHDIVSGSNGHCSPSYLCHAVAGYDGPTGLGTPMGDRAFGAPDDDDDDNDDNDDDNDDNDNDDNDNDDDDNDNDDNDDNDNDNDNDDNDNDDNDNDNDDNDNDDNNDTTDDDNDSADDDNDDNDTTDDDSSPDDDDDASPTRPHHTGSGSTNGSSGCGC